MKLIKCLNEQCLDDYVGVVENAVKPRFYTVKYILQNKSNLLEREVFAIDATIAEVDYKQFPVVLYYLGI